MKANTEKTGTKATTAKAETLIMALLTERTISEACKKVGISETTAWRIMQEDGFQELYREARRQAVSQAISQLQQAGGAAVQTLQSVMDNSESPASARVTAAKAILDYSLKALETEDLAVRVEKIEQAMTQNGGR